ncbi:MAG: phosphopyruvate hydratase [Candidatus Paceibacterota bacterium]|jgi:enolase
MKILSLKAREILDSRGNPTVEVELETQKGKFIAGAPSGASTGIHEALELRDGGTRRGGLGVLKAVGNINEIIAPEIIGKEIAFQKSLDQLMLGLDGTENKSKLGANAMVAVSMAACRALAAEKDIPPYQYINELFNQKREQALALPRPCFNVINGGAHAGNDLDVQEFMVVPQADSFAENLEIGAEVYRELKSVLKNKIGPSAINVGDEGGFAPALEYSEEALDLILEASDKKGLREKIKFILDVAASQFFEDGKYKTKMGIFTGVGLANYYLDLVSKYPIIGIEDPFAEDDFEAWSLLNSRSKGGLIIIGDDLTVTNPKRMKMAQEKRACNGMILKINQIGTITEALESANLAKELKWKIIVSHRSGETGDDFIADLAVGIGAEFIKSGAPARGERAAKYNRLLKIGSELKQ